MSDKYIEVNNIYFSYVDGEELFEDKHKTDLSKTTEAASDEFEDEYNDKLVLENIKMSINKGQHIALLGHNGSGKSTLARLLNALEIPDSGTIKIDGEIATDLASAIKIRQKCGMVFQNPDNQLIGTTVKEEIAFGPENLGIKRESIIRRVDNCAKLVGLEKYLHKSPTNLSGGQKQKLAIAGILAMEPRVILLDEATSMLDPQSRKEFLLLCEDLRQKYRLIFVNITHDMEEVILTDYVYVLHEGRIVLEGKPKDIFSQKQLLKELGLDIPFGIKLQQEFFEFLEILKEKWEKAGIIEQSRASEELFSQITNCRQALLKQSQLNDEEIKAFFQDFIILWQKFIEKTAQLEKNTKQKMALLIQDAFSSLTLDESDGGMICPLNVDKHIKELILRVENISYEYPTMGEHRNQALSNISFNLHAGEILGIMGETGSGKSTLMQHLNGLLIPDKGNVWVKKSMTDNIEAKVSVEEKNKQSEESQLWLNTRNKKDRPFIRQDIGLLFQYPEHQLFAQTVIEDVKFGPRQMGVDEEEIDVRLKEVWELLDLKEELLYKSPFELSGGQKRKVAMAGVLMSRPKVLVLDEPAAGLDPRAKKQMLDLVYRLRDKGISVIMVSHSMDDLLAIADNILVLKNGEKIISGSTADVFLEENYLQELRLDLPQALKWTHFFHQNGLFKNYFEKVGKLPAKGFFDLFKRIVKNLRLSLEN